MSAQQSILRYLKRPLLEPCPKRKVQRTENESLIAPPTVEISSTSSDDAGNRSQINRSVAELRLKIPSAVRVLIRNMDSEWCFHLAGVIRSDAFTKLANFVEQERAKTTIYPPQEEVFTWSKLTPPSRVKVVILGQDPYHGPQQAHGLAFSVRRPQRPPPSLVNIYKEIASDCDIAAPKNWPPSHGDLTRWAEQGVLLLNAVLTVRSSQPNSHKGQGWEKLTGAVINYVNLHCSHVVFLLWGANAQAQGASIDRKRHLVLHAPHPSPFSADRGFFGCKHFSKANAYLKDHRLQPINWTDLS